MTLTEAHTENVKRAWMVKQQGPDLGNRVFESGEWELISLHHYGYAWYANDKFYALSLSEALDLLAWVAQRMPTGDDNAWGIEDVKFIYWSYGRFSTMGRLEGYGMAAKPRFGNWFDASPEKKPPKDGAGHVEDPTEAVLLAIDAIVGKHPEVLE